MIAKTPKTHRLPHWYAASCRWRMSIGFQHAVGGRRQPRPFYWPADYNGGTPPPVVIAEAVGRQNDWRRIVCEWPDLKRKLACVMPERDWSLPVWVENDTFAKMDAGERAGIEYGIAMFQAEVDAEEQREAEQAARWFARNGLAAMVNVLRDAFPTPTFSPGFAEHRRAERINRIDAERVTALAELQPVVARVMVRPVTVREAVEVYLTKYANRTTLKTSLGIDERTSDTLAERVRAAFGQSSGADKPPIRETPIAFDAPLSSIDRSKLEAFATYWHTMPAGVRSERTIKNVLEAARSFFTWCGNEPLYGWSLPPDSAALLTAANVARDAMDFDPALLRKIIEEGGRRVQMYALFGLCFGFTQSDIQDTLETEMFTIGEDRFVQRLRSKEPKLKRGTKPIRVRHWITPEFAKLIEAERNVNANGTLFRSERGVPLTADTIGDLWNSARARIDADLPFSQLRKIGGNRIKVLAGGVEGLLMSEFWKAHALNGVAKSYEDGVWPAMNDVEKLWSAQLRSEGIL